MCFFFFLNDGNISSEHLSLNDVPVLSEALLRTVTKQILDGDLYKIVNFSQQYDFALKKINK